MLNWNYKIMSSLKIILSYTIMWNYANIKLWKLGEIIQLYFINDKKLKIKKLKFQIYVRII